MNLHDTNISNFLRFLGYFDAFGYSNYSKFASSVRLELVHLNENYFIRFVYDNEEVNLPFCGQSKYCPFEAVEKYFQDNLIADAS